ncbi:hypothetical protein SAMN05216464_113152 [Mucilaginibacter pineti]|uniref:TerB family tellurite resistance protein n=1 Tax=Mucilaginibacter pineti TaxID=1391627 RepID=A0A1G7ISW3_9SPHI|nr:hypothetical protein [Mucilaginibacter pineti]SDF15822.1 hypothetical protein SAMN05216464_113152 [Mucilaginibacter pineti]
MKKLPRIALCMFFFSIISFTVRAQSVSDLLEQLALDYQKLAGMKNILSQMYKGYEVLTKGYNSVRDVSQGNFSLHQVFLDGLLTASPAVRKYPRAGDIISDQSSILAEYQRAWQIFRRDKNFSPKEVSYMLSVYNNLVKASGKNIDDLSLILSDNKLRMSDAERLAAIDRIYMESQSQLNYLRKFNDETYKMALQRSLETNDRQNLKNLYGIN